MKYKNKLNEFIYSSRYIDIKIFIKIYKRRVVIKLYFCDVKKEVKRKYNSQQNDVKFCF